MGEDVQHPENPNISIRFEEKDLSIGTARFWHDHPVNKNLSIHSTRRGFPPNLNLHSNVEVHFFNSRGKEVPSRRMVRTWNVVPEQDATVQSLGQWRVVGLDPGSSPFVNAPRSEVSPIDKPMSPRNFAKYGPTNFTKDNPGKIDSPGFTLKSAADKPSGQLQEFLVGNTAVGGVYYQTYVMLDNQGNGRVINANKIILSASQYRETLRRIHTGEYKRTNLTKLMFDVKHGETDATFALEEPASKQTGPKQQTHGPNVHTTPKRTTPHQPSFR